MIIVRPEDVIHKAWLLRLLGKMADNSLISLSIFFKGGTCASMLGYLDRFSVDLDFDLVPKASKIKLKKQLLSVFSDLDLEIKNQSSKTLTFNLKYPNPQDKRNSIKLTILPMAAKSNRYKPQYLPEIDRIITCQTIETMFANKLVAPLDRFKRYQTIAGRDIYDIHHFFLSGYQFEPKIIEERTNLSVKNFLEKLTIFIDKRITQRVIDEDLNTLLVQKQFLKIRKVLKTETLAFLSNEIKRMSEIKE